MAPSPSTSHPSFVPAHTPSQFHLHPLAFRNYVRIGTAILVEQDFADIFLPLAKCCRYAQLQPLDDVFFAIFALAWLPTRHFLFFSIYGSIVQVATGQIEVPEGWDYETGYF
eukprot:SAG11_NODE_12953_length_677_cov_1.077855_2_plen_111_part_01